MKKFSELSAELQQVAKERVSELYVNRDYVTGKDFVIVGGVAIDLETIQEGLVAAPIPVKEPKYVAPATTKATTKAKRVKELAPAPELAPVVTEAEKTEAPAAPVTIAEE